MIGFPHHICSADETIYYVPDDYPTIQDAIDVAEDGDIIQVKSGVYYESIVIDKQITLIGDGIVEINANEAYYGFELRADGIRIENLKVTHCGSGGNKAAIRIISNRNTVKDCIIQHNHNFGLIIYKNASENLVQSVTVSDNYCGIYIESATSNIISDSTLFDNAIYGIHIRYSNDNILHGNSISDEIVGIYLWRSYNNTIKDNSITSCSLHGVDLRTSHNNLIYNNYLNCSKNGYDTGVNNYYVDLSQDTNIISGPYLCGNYWSDYSDGDIDENGIGDTSYEIPGGNNIDPYPLCYQPNYAPYPPYDPYPADSSESIERSVTLSWNCIDPEANTITYEIFFDSSTPPIQCINSSVESSYHIDGLDYSQVYYWQIVAHGTTPWNHITMSPIWSFTTKSSPQQPSYGESTGSDNEEDTPFYHNNPPLAEISVEKYQGYINEYFIFDASTSTDPDGVIENYEWNLGDGTQQTGQTISHKYNSMGKYTVTLTVIDNFGLKSKETAHIIVIKANNPPETPEIIGPSSGSVGTSYSYNVIGIDLDNDNIQYIINWADATTDRSLFLPNATSYSFNHMWANPGAFTISVKASDNETESSSKYLKILIDAIYVSDLGILIDTTQNGVYDLYYSNNTSIETNVQSKQDDVYLIDDNGDGIVDYTFSTATQQIDVYNEPILTDENNNTMMLLSIFFIIIIIFLVLIAVIYQIRRNK